MKKSYLKHSFEYILVFAILITAIFLLNFFHDPNIRLMIITLFSFLYILVGVLHHFEEKNLKASQVLEHIAIGAIIFIVLSALYR